MVNIHEILKKFEISIPADKKEEFDKLMVENYKTVKEVINLQGKLENMEKERDTYLYKYDALYAYFAPYLEDLYAIVLPYSSQRYASNVLHFCQLGS